MTLRTFVLRDYPRWSQTPTCDPYISVGMFQENMSPVEVAKAFRWAAYTKLLVSCSGRGGEQEFGHLDASLKPLHNLGNYLH